VAFLDNLNSCLTFDSCLLFDSYSIAKLINRGDSPVVRVYGIPLVVYSIQESIIFHVDFFTGIYIH